MKKLTRVCEECYGTSFVSLCCGISIEEYEVTCHNCGEICTAEHCDCTNGEDVFKVGDTVHFCVTSINSDETELHKEVYKKYSTEIYHGSIVTCVIEKIISHDSVLCKIFDIEESKVILIKYLETT